MDRLFILTVFLLLASCDHTSKIKKSELGDFDTGNKKSTSDTPRLYTDSSFEEMRVGETVSALRKSYKGSDFSYNKDFSGYAFLDKKHNVELFLSTSNDTVTMISILNNSIRLAMDTNLYVGASVKIIKERYKNVPIRFNNLDEIEFFKIPYLDNFILLVYAMPMNRTLGHYTNSVRDSAYLYDTDDSISSISILAKNSIMDPDYGKK